MPPKASKPAPAPAAPSTAAAQQASTSTGISDFELPKTTLTKLAKGSIPDNVKMQQDVVLALLRSSTVFISYLSAAAHDQAAARSGKSITASDVIKAISELDFGPGDSLVPILDQELGAYRANTAAAKANKSRIRAKGRKSTNEGVDDEDRSDGD